MKRNTPLDYAEFSLTHSRSRCELYISANSVKEKLASGYLKPFVAHLRAAEAQFAKGNQVIRLERPSNFQKKNKVTWFTKGTVERFVRFVSTPEVLEWVKGIDDELSQLEHVRIALSRTFPTPQSEVPLYIVDATNPGFNETKGSVPVKDERSLMGTGDNAADASKIELLRAMDVRLIALRQEQSEAFCRAVAAGFDSSNMADLLDFSEHFGAERLREACIQFIGLFRKRNIAQEMAERVEAPSADADPSDSDMSLESCTDSELVAETREHSFMDVKAEWPKAVNDSVPDNARKPEKDKKSIPGKNFSSRTRSRWGPPERIQMNRLNPEIHETEVYMRKGEVKQQPGIYSHQDDITHSDSVFQSSEDFQTAMNFQDQSKRSPLIGFSAPPVDGYGGTGLEVIQQSEGDNRRGMFFSRLHKMAQQVEARRSSEDLGVQFTSVERGVTFSGSQLSGYRHSSQLYDTTISPCSDSSLPLVSDGVAVRQQRRQENRLVAAHPSPGSISPMLEETLNAGHLHSADPKPIMNSHADYGASEKGTENRTDILNKSGKSTSESSKLKDNQEEPVSNSARRLSVQAAISLFESKKESVSEPPMRKLVRQDSQKGVVRSGNSANEKSVLRRWSGVGIDGADYKQDGASEAGEKGPEKVVIVTENAVQKTETSIEANSPRINKPPTLATDRSSSHANYLAKQSVHLDASFSKEMPSAQQQSFVEFSTELPSEVLHKQSKQEVHEILTRTSSSNFCMRDIHPSVPVIDTLKPNESKIGSGAMGPEQGKDVVRAPVGKKVADMKVDCGVQEKHNSMEQKKKAMPMPDNSGETEIIPKRVPSSKGYMSDGLSVEPLQLDSRRITPGSLGIIDTSKRLSTHKEENIDGLPIEKQNLESLNHETGKSRPSGNELSLKNHVKAEKTPSSILHETPVDLYMQALVMIIDNYHQSSLISSGDEESLKEPKGRFYEHYWRLRNARRRGENPVKRAEREAKLKSMQEILERRKAEMQAGISQQVKNNRLIKEQKGKAQGVQKSGPSRILQEEKEMGGDEVVAQLDAPVFAPSYAQIMPNAKLQATRKTAPKLQKNISASRSIMTTSMSSLKTGLKKQTSTGLSVSKQCKVAPSSYDGLVDSLLDKNALTNSQRGSNKFSSVCTEGLVKSIEKKNEHCHSVNFPVSTMIAANNPVVAHVDILSTPAEIGFTYQRSETRKDQSFSSKEEFSHLQTHLTIEPSKGHQDSDPYTFGNDRPLSTAQNMKIFSLDDCENFSILGTGTVKHQDSDKKYSLESCDDEQVLLSKQKLLKSIDGESAGYLCEHAVDDERVLLSKQVEKDKGEQNLQKDQVPSHVNSYEESSAFTSADKSLELSCSDSNSSPSLFQDCTTSTYSDAAASPINLYEENSGTVAGTSSPKVSLFPHSPSRSPVSWIRSKAAQSSKEPARGFRRLLHFGRKSRTSESTSIDGVSVSTASEGDDEAEEVKGPMKQSSDELARRPKSQEKVLHVTSNKDSSGLQDQGASRITFPNRSSSNKSLDEHILGGTSLKESWSFFSLSNFRSRGNEGKSR